MLPAKYMISFSIVISFIQLAVSKIVFILLLEWICIPLQHALIIFLFLRQHIFDQMEFSGEDFFMGRSYKKNL